MKHILTSTLLCAIVLLPATSIHANSTEWTINYNLWPEIPCTFAQLQITLRDSTGKALDDFCDSIETAHYFEDVGSLSIPTMPPGSYYLEASIRDCSGAWSEPVTLDLWNEELVQTMSVSVMVNARDGLVINFLEARADLDGTAILRAIEKDRSLQLQNISNRRLQRCPFRGMADSIRLEYLVQGDWKWNSSYVYPRAQYYSWPLHILYVEPNEAITFQDRSIRVHLLPPGEGTTRRRARPASKRYKVYLTPEYTFSMLYAPIAEDYWQLLPSCDCYVLPMPVSADELVGLDMWETTEDGR